MLVFVIAFMLIAIALLTYDWKLGIYLIIVVGFLQDPVRKSIVNEPVSISVIVAVVFVFCACIAFIANRRWSLSHLIFDNELLFRFLFGFVFFIFSSALYSWFLYQTWLVPILGLSTYFMPLIAATYASLILDNYSRVSAFIRFYLGCIVVIVLTIGLSVIGVEHAYLKEVSGGIDIYEHSINNYIQAHAGLIRTSELAAWHLATGACFSILMLFQTKARLLKLLFSIITVLCLLAGVFTGRRKMYILIIVFCLLLLIFALYDLHFKKRFITILSVLIAGFILVIMFKTFQKQLLFLSFANDYLSRTFTLVDDSANRLELSLYIFTYTMQHISLFGDGAGSTAQGISHLVTGKTLWNAETGLGRLGNELGLFGLGFCAFLAIVLFFHILRINRIIQSHDEQLSLLQKGLIAFLIANVFNYFNAAQAYNDPFVLLILGFTFGCILTIPKILYARITKG